MRFGIPAGWIYRAIRWFHRKAARVFVATPSLETELRERGFRNEFARWGRGVDTDLFRPLARDAIDAERPILGYLGRVAVEKNIEAFLDLDVPGTKVVLGGGPALEDLRGRYPGVRFFGMLPQARLPELLSALDVFVFPSRTDTFGIVMIEANACGTPVAAYPVIGPVDVVEEGRNGALDEDLAAAVRRAQGLDRAACREHALGYTWARSVEQFEAGLVRIPRGAEAAVRTATPGTKAAGGVAAGQ
jgi:glycosyltransferase involved in cell wall biosynthesis